MPLGRAFHADGVFDTSSRPTRVRLPQHRGANGADSLGMAAADLQERIAVNGHIRTIGTLRYDRCDASGLAWRTSAATIRIGDLIAYGIGDTRTGHTAALPDAIRRASTAS